jgi:hypothetical protein
MRNDGPAAEAEPIAAGTVLDRLRVVLREKRAAGNLVLPPQAILPLDDDEFQTLSAFPWRRAIHATFQMDIRDLLSTYDETFVGNCHRGLLLRDPWPHEVRQWMDRLSAGWPRTVVIMRLRLSREGRRVGVGVRGLWLALPLLFCRRVSVLVRRRHWASP